MLGFCGTSRGIPTNAVMYELMVAARTDEKLRATLQEVLTEYGAKIFEAIRALPGVDECAGADARHCSWSRCMNTFDGAAIVRAVAATSRTSTRTDLAAGIAAARYLRDPSA